MVFLCLTYGEREREQKRFDKWKEKMTSKNITSYQDVPDTLHLTRPLRKPGTQIAVDAQMHPFYIH